MRVFRIKGGFLPLLLRQVLTCVSYILYIISYIPTSTVVVYILSTINGLKSLEDLQHAT